MQKWEYCEVNFTLNRLRYYRPGEIVEVDTKKEKARTDASDGHTLRRVIAKLGSEGWEMVASLESSGTMVLMKRPLG